MEQRRHNTRHAAALAAAAALEDGSCGLSSSSGHPQDSKHPPHSSSSSSSSGPPSSASQSPVTVKTQQSPRKTPSPLEPSKMASKREMYDSFQAWALKTYGDSAKTKTVTRRKYNRIFKILKGEEQTSAENSKFRFWVKAKGFRIGPPTGPSTDFKRTNQVLYIPCSKIQMGANNKDDSTIYKKVAVVENFFDIIYGVHVEMDGRGGKHAGQKRTYKAIAEMYSFLPREAVTHFLMSCADCQKRMHLAGSGGGSEGKGGTSSGASGHHGNLAVAAEQQEELSGGSELSSSPDDETELHIDYSLPITTTYLKHMRSLGYSEEDALNPDREDSDDVESEFSEEPQVPPVATTSNQQQYDVPMEEETIEEQQSVVKKETAELSNVGPLGRPLDMRQPKQENGHITWSVNEPLNMTKVDLSNNHQDHSYERTLSPCNGCGKRETSATPDNLSAGTKDEDDEDDDEDADKIDINKYDPERLKAFNMFVRLFVDENLDRMVPISRQPKDKIQAIIDSCTRQFPEFSERARKRIRTYLKSCRRNKRTRENSNWEMGRSTHPHLTSAQAEQILAAACENESQNAKRMRLGLKPIPAETDRGGRGSHSSHTMSEIESRTGTLSRSPQHENILQATLRHGRPPSSTATSMLNGNAAYAQGSPTYSSSYRLVPNTNNRTLATAQASSNGHPTGVNTSTTSLTNVPTDLSMKKCGGSAPENALKHSLNPGDVGQVKLLIAGYRESAAFLLRSADELEMLLHQQQ